MLRPLALVAALACLGAAGSIPAAPVFAQAARPDFKRDFGAFADQLAADPSAPPGFVVLVVKGGETVFERAYGVRDVATGARMTLDTPVYTASTTKTYVGLLAARLDAKGVLPLTTTMKDVWPELVLPAPLDASKITAAELLSHTSGFIDSGLNWRPNEAGNITSAEVPAHLAKFSQAAPDKAFRYSNFGPYIYSMMVETRLRRDWKSVLRDEVFRPMGLNRTAIRLEDLKAGSIAHCNGRIGGAWRSIPLKPTPILNAGGGVYASGRDAAAYLKAFATRGGSLKGRIAPGVLARTYDRFAVQSVDFVGLKRDGYGLGWDLADYDGQRLVTRSGGFIGCRSLYAFSPETGVGVVVLTVGDAAANTFNVTLVKQAFDLMGGRPDVGAKRIADYSTGAKRALGEADALKLPDLTPKPGFAVAGFAGTYEDPRLGAFTVKPGGAGLVARMGVFTVDLVPQGGDVFTGYAQDDPTTQLDFKFVRGADGRIVSMTWDNRVFARK